MTRYKKYLQNKGFKLENDFPYLPFEHIETVQTFIIGSTIRIRIYDNRIGWYGYVVFTDGEVLGVEPNC